MCDWCHCHHSVSSMQIATSHCTPWIKMCSSQESKNLRIVSEDSIKGAVIGNLTEVVVDNPLEMLEVLRKGEISRSYGSTTMNAERYTGHFYVTYSLRVIYLVIIIPRLHCRMPLPMLYSSRSHTIYRISIESVEIDSDTDIAGVGRGVVAGVTRLSFMNLVDLAGMEGVLCVCVCVCVCLCW